MEKEHPPNFENVVDAKEAAPFREDIEKEKKALAGFFGFDVEVPELPESVSPEAVERLKGLGFELRYLPDIRFEKDSQFPGWKTRPGEVAGSFEGGASFLDDGFQSHVFGEANRLPGSWAMVDRRPKPEYDGGKQMYEDDELIGGILRSLRERGLIKDAPAKESRYGVEQSSFYNPQVIKAFETGLGLPPDAAVVLPRAIEWNFLVNAYHQEWGQTGTLEWHEDIYDKTQVLAGGSRGEGGSAYIEAISPEFSADDIGFRLMIILGQADVSKRHTLR